MVNNRAASRSTIDLSKLRRRLRMQRRDTIFAMLEDAIDLLSPAKLQQLVGRYMALDELRVEEPAPRVNTPSRLRVAVEGFVEASRRGDYFETFDVNSKNCTEQSNGTVAWISELGRMLDQCVAYSSRRTGLGDVLIAFELLFELIEQASCSEPEILFFADEGGIWEFGIAWREVGAALMSCVARAKVAGSREDRIARLVERCGGEAGDVGRELVKARLRFAMPLG